MILHAAGEDLRSLVTDAAQAVDAMHLTPTARLRIVDCVPTYGEALFAVLSEHDYDVIVAKRLDGRIGPADKRLGARSRIRRIRGARCRSGGSDRHCRRTRPLLMEVVLAERAGFEPALGC
jgi:hypothetical protein